MPEGHTIHRAAQDHHKRLSGQTLQVSSPQGKFSAGSEVLSGKLCHSVEALGKHLLYRFESRDVLHVHLGLFGRIRSGRLPLKEPIGAVRVRLVGDTHCIDINGPAICEVMGAVETKVLFNRIGPDILRSDAEPIRAFARTAKSKLPIGQLLMDQSVIAGIGNIFRSEILWRQGVHPKTPGNAIDETTFNKIWEDAIEICSRSQLSIIRLSPFKMVSPRLGSIRNGLTYTRKPGVRNAAGNPVSQYGGQESLCLRKMSAALLAQVEYPNG